MCTYVCVRLFALFNDCYTYICLFSYLTFHLMFLRPYNTTMNTHAHMLIELSGACTSISRTDWSTSSSPSHLRCNGASLRRGRPTTSPSPVRASQQGPMEGSRPLGPPVNQVGGMEWSGVAFNFSYACMCVS